MSNSVTNYFGERYLGVCRRVWNRLPEAVKLARFGRWYGGHVNCLVRAQVARNQSFGTFFLRNRPELELLCDLLGKMKGNSGLKLAVLACSKGAEVYSIAYTLLTARPNLEVSIQALDICPEILEFARRGVYSLEGVDCTISGGTAPAVNGTDLASKTWQGQNRSIFERLSADELEKMFDRNGDHASVKATFRKGITWHLGDAGDTATITALGLQDVVIANRFLCHMSSPAAERCLRNLSKLVKPGGYLFVTGVDLDVRSRVARELGWTPITDLVEEIHEGDPSLRRDWPLHYWGLEPLDRKRRDWQLRYASIFRLGAPVAGSRT